MLLVTTTFDYLKYFVELFQGGDDKVCSKLHFCFKNFAADVEIKRSGNTNSCLRNNNKTEKSFGYSASMKRKEK